MFLLKDSFVNRYKNRQPPYGFAGLGQFVDIRTYTHVIDGANEKPYQQVRRMVEGTFQMQEQHIVSQNLGWNDERAQKSAQEMFDRIFNLKFTPSGRGRWAMGAEIITNRGIYAALNSCAFVSTAFITKETVKPFTFCMDMSMLGVGVGFDVLGAGKLSLLPTDELKMYTVSDDREGWVESLKLLLDGYFATGTRWYFDYSIIREKGLPIKGFGGTSSGPEPLRLLHESIRELLDPLAKTLLTETAIADIMNLIGVCVVAGNVRRTAEISFGSPYSEEYLTLKDYKWDTESGEYVGPRANRAKHGWTSNNSVFAELGMDYRRIAELIHGNGEPGFFWLENAQKFGRMCEPANNKDRRVLGANPSMPAGTLVGTDLGILPIEELEGSSFGVKSLDGTWAPAKCRKSGTDKPLKLIDFGGNRLTMSTPEHKWPVLTERGIVRKAASDLAPGDAIPLNRNELTGVCGDTSLTREDGFFVGYVFGDGWISQRKNGCAIGNYVMGISIGEGKADLAQRLSDYMNLRKTNDSAVTVQSDESLIQTSSQPFITKFIEDFGWEGKTHLPTKLWRSNDEFILGFLDGIFSTDGHISLDQRVSLSTSQPDVASEVQKLLSFYGIPSSVSVRQVSSTFPNGREYNKTYTTCQVRVSQSASQNFKNIVHLSNTAKAKRLAAIPNRPVRDYAIIKSVTDAGTADVWDITVYHDQHVFPAQHTYTGNCNEQSLEHMEMCNLVEVFLNNHDNIEDFKRTLKFAYLYAKTVTLGKTHWPETNKVMLRNRRIGTSLTGIKQFIAKNSLDTLKQWCMQGYDTIQGYDRSYSEWLAIPRSIKTTSVKPSGTVSLLAGATPGLHDPEANHYIRRVRVSKTSPFIERFKASNYVVEACVGDSSSVVVEFPIALREKLRTINDVSLWEQVSMAAFMQRWWADNQVSATISFDPDKVSSDEIAHCLDFFQYDLKGISFLPKTPVGAYAQMPYQEITEAEYEEHVSGLLPVDLSGIGEEAVPETGCNNDMCELPDTPLSKTIYL